MHVEAISQPLLSLAANLALETFAVAGGHKVRRKVIAKVLADCSTLSQNDGLIERRGRDSDQRRFAERVNGFELRRCELVGLPLVHFHVVGSFLGTFFEEPDDTLGAGLFEPGFG